jgi:hypothetical protein
LCLPRGGELATARVIKQTCDGYGVPTGSGNSNPILDTRQYEVEFPDGSINIYTANVIAENLGTIIDPEGKHYALFKGIIDHRYVDHRRDTTYVDDAGNHQPKASTLV